MVELYYHENASYSVKKLECMKEKETNRLLSTLGIKPH